MKLHKAPFIAGRIILKPLGKKRETGEPQFTSEFTAVGRAFLGKKKRCRRYDSRAQHQKSVNSDNRELRNAKSKARREKERLERKLRAEGRAML